MTSNTSEVILDQNVRHQIGIQRRGSGILKDVLPLLKQAEKDILGQIASSDIDSFKSRRLKSLLKSIREALSQASLKLEEELTGQLSALAVYESAYQKELLSKSVPLKVDIVSPNEKQLTALVLGTPLNGRLLGEWTAEWGVNTFRKVRDNIRLGVVEGKTNTEIVRDIKGTKANGYKDGVIAGSRRGIEAMVRTSTNHIANTSRELLYKENEDLVKEIKIVATLDSRTSPICREKDGLVYPVGVGERPPFHINCRTTTTPVIKSWKELGFNIDELPVGTRASMNGKVPQDLTYSDWLKKQNKETQIEVLGKTRYKLFKSGKEDMGSYVDDKGRLYTLNELQRRDADAFNKADL